MSRLRTEINQGRRLLLHAGAASIISAVTPGSLFSTPADAEGYETGDPLIWYREPAVQWKDALPLGNGRLGAMIFGGVELERIALNEDTLWSGGPYSPAKQIAKSTLDQIRDLIFQGKLKEAQAQAVDLQGNPPYQSMYQTVGELRMRFAGMTAGFEGYRRELNLARALTTVTYTSNGVHYTRETFASHRNNVIVVRLKASKPGSIHFDLDFNTPQKAHLEAVKDNGLRLIGQNGPMGNGHAAFQPGKLAFEGRVRVLTEQGSTTASDERISVSGADVATVLVTAATSYRRYDDVSGDPAETCAGTLDRAVATGYLRMLREHLTDHRRLFGRVQLSLGRSSDSNKSTDERLRQFTLANDPEFAALYFQFGRYLLISSSREGGQPTNLQGMWNEDLSPAWGGKYTININTEMNYWPVYTTNIAECDEPLISMVRDMSETGAVTARKIYGARGWVCHHNTDLWRATAPIDGSFPGQWPLGGAWLCNALFERYFFTMNRDSLKRLYPIIKGAVLFFEDFLIPDPRNGYLVTCPSMSPEHARDRGISIAAGPTVDMQILRVLFRNCITAAQTLGVDGDNIATWARIRERLAPNLIGKEGQLQEWQEDIDIMAPDRAHRHMSPLYGLFPGNEITPADERMTAAARKLMEMRTDTSNMGWAVAWRANLWARLGDSNHAALLLEELIGQRTEMNLFDMPRIQLDGNFGGTSAIAEMLLQSHAGYTHLLPALPEAWPDGFVSGLLARGGLTVSIRWRDGVLKETTLHSSSESTATVRYRDTKETVRIRRGGDLRLGPTLQHLT